MKNRSVSRNIELDSLHGCSLAVEGESSSRTRAKMLLKNSVPCLERLVLIHIRKPSISSNRDAFEIRCIHVYMSGDVVFAFKEVVLSFDGQGKVLALVSRSRDAGSSSIFLKARIRLVLECAITSDRTMLVLVAVVTIGLDDRLYVFFPLLLF